MSGWHKKDDYIFFAIGRSGSTSLDHAGFEHVIEEFDIDFKLINFYLRDTEIKPVVFIRHPLDRFYSAMFQFMMRICEELNVEVTADEEQWVSLWDTFLELLNFDRGAPIFNDNEFYHMGHYLDRLRMIEKDLIIADTRDMNQTIKDLVGVSIVKQNATNSKYEVNLYNGVFKRAFEKAKHKNNALVWLHPEIQTYKELVNQF